MSSDNLPDFVEELVQSPALKFVCCQNSAVLPIQNTWKKQLKLDSIQILKLLTVNSVAKENGFVEFSVNAKSNQGCDGFMSQIFWITISENGSDKRLDLLCKLAPLNEKIREDLSLGLVFDREALFYTKLMPTFAQFQVEKKLSQEDQFLSYPKCYGTLINAESGQFTIISEDLRPQEFKMWKKSQPFSIENALMVMRELGKYHGLSFALKDQKPEEFAKIEKIRDTMLEVYGKESMLEMNIPFYERAIESLKRSEHKSIMEHISDNYLAYVTACLRSDNAPFGVLIHGDAWSNNMLFQFNEKNVVKDMRFLDFQVIQYGSPAIDLVYNIFTSTDKALRDKEYDNIIGCYYESLSKTVRLLGSNPDDLFTFENLQDELKRCGNFALLVAPSMLEIKQADSELSNLDDVFDKMAQGEEMIGLSEAARREYALRLNEVFEDIVRLGYYHKVN